MHPNIAVLLVAIHGAGRQSWRRSGDRRGRFRARQTLFWRLSNENFKRDVARHDVILFDGGDIILRDTGDGAKMFNGEQLARH